LLKSKIERLISGQLPETSHSITWLITTIQNSNFWGLHHYLEMCCFFCLLWRLWDAIVTKKTA